jgi:hypothetical protein
MVSLSLWLWRSSRPSRHLVSEKRMLLWLLLGASQLSKGFADAFSGDWLVVKSGISEAPAHAARSQERLRHQTDLLKVQGTGVATAVRGCIGTPSSKR